MFSLTPRRREESSRAVTPRQGLDLIRNEFENLFGRFFGDWPAAFADGWDTSPAWGMDVDEKEKEVVVRAELPGFEARDIDVNMTENVLTIEARHTDAKGEEKGNGNGSRRFRNVRRSFTLPSGLDAEKVEATYRNGVLELHFPRLPEAQGRKIEVKS